MRKLSNKIIKAINIELREDVREEAKEILYLTTDKERSEFLEAHKEDKGNICCLILDYAKKELVKQGVLEQKETDAFGKFIEEE